MKNVGNGAMRVLVLGGLLACLPMLAMGDAKQPGRSGFATSQAGLASQVRHNLRMLPYYGVFDNLEFQMQGDRVVLSGQVVWPILKSDAENAVKRIEGVSEVTNNIEVLPLSRFDEQIRFAEYRAIFGRGSLYRYAQGVNPSIHIIVDGGRVTLVGVVDNKMDSQLANMAANAVPGVFAVTNNLRIG